MLKKETSPKVILKDAFQWVTMPSNEQHPNYHSFRETISEQRAPVVFWIGAGVSSDAKLPNWRTLRELLCDAAIEEIATLPTSEADLKELELQKAQLNENLWESFEAIKDILGYPIYKDQLRRNLAPSDKVEVPNLHLELWRIPAVRGVISLNIDGLETRAHRLIRPGEVVDEFIGRDLRSHLQSMKDRRPFIGRLHGHHSDASSWIFTARDLKSLTSDNAYRIAIESLFSNFTVVFLGISADDVAAGGFLHTMTAYGLDMGNHFWITNRSDKVTTDWCRSAGVLRVPYSVVEGETHTSVILDLLRKSVQYKSHDRLAPPVKYSGKAVSAAPSVSDLKTMSEGEARSALNAYARYLLEEGAGRTDTVQYQNFLATYSAAIHQAWHLSELQGYNDFFDYTAVEKIHGGPFSSVWRVRSSSQEQYALKIIQIDNLRKGAQLDSFRRGIASQKLLRDSGVMGGIARIEAAFEIPPSVIMEYVEGENLEEISSKAAFNFWVDGLAIVANVCRVVDAAHRSKYGVLHRDLRPHNIMVPNYYYGSNASDFDLDQYEVKLLNYDLTWHKDASGRVIPVDPISVGYFAPELLVEPDSERARDARVDSYGIGMTLLRVSTGRVPPTGGSSSTDWFSALGCVKKAKGIWFKSAHNYIARLIEHAAMPQPSDRLLVGDVLVEIESLRIAISSGVASAESRFLAENLIFSICGDEFEVSRSRTIFSRNLGGYRSYQIEADEKKQAIHLLFTNTSINTEDWSKIDKLWSTKLASAREILSSGLWKVNPKTGYSQRVITLSASIDLATVRANYTKVQDALGRAISRAQNS